MLSEKINFSYVKFYFLLRCGNHKEENGLGWRDRQGSVPICSVYYVTVLIQHYKQYKSKRQKGTKANTARSLHINHFFQEKTAVIQLTVRFGWHRCKWMCIDTYTAQTSSPCCYSLSVHTDYAIGSGHVLFLFESATRQRVHYFKTDIQHWNLQAKKKRSW